MTSPFKLYNTDTGLLDILTNQKWRSLREFSKKMQSHDLNKGKDEQHTLTRIVKRSKGTLT